MVQNILKPMSSSSYGTAARESGNLPILPYDTQANSPAETATMTAKSASGSSAVILSANVLRKSVTFYNGGSTICYLAFGATATTSVFTVQIAASASYSLATPIYRGVISAIWAGSPSGSLQITEY